MPVRQTVLPSAVISETPGGPSRPQISARTALIESASKPISTRLVAAGSVRGLTWAEHPDMPRRHDPRPVREGAEAHRTTGRCVHQPLGHREIHVAEVHPLELRRRCVEPQRSLDIRHIPVRHRFEIQPDKFAPAGPDPQAVRVKERNGRRSIRGGRRRRRYAGLVDGVSVIRSRLGRGRTGPLRGNEYSDDDCDGQNHGRQAFHRLVEVHERHSAHKRSAMRKAIHWPRSSRK